jgi:predicted DNA-binding transcriptional regulator YafY
LYVLFIVGSPSGFDVPDDNRHCGQFLSAIRASIMAMLATSTRLLRLLTSLQGRRTWAGPALAQHLEVTGRTLRRDIDRLRTLGYAVAATSGRGGGYQLGQGTALPPLLLNDEEAVAVVVALRSAADSFAGMGETAIGALAKLDQLLPRRLRRRAGALHAMTVSVGQAGTIDAAVLTTLASACRDHEQVGFKYRDHAGKTEARTVEPLRLAHTGNRRWYLIAWDLARGDWRTFRVDRIAARPSVGARFVPRKPPEDLERYVARSISAAPYRYQARVRLRGSARALAAQVPPWCGVLEPVDDDSCLLSTGAGSLEALVCQIIVTGTDFEVIEPAELRAPILGIARRLARGARAQMR